MGPRLRGGDESCVTAALFNLHKQMGANGNTAHAHLRIIGRFVLRSLWQRGLRLRDDGAKHGAFVHRKIGKGFAVKIDTSQL